jgi:2'-5' RNA ligase
MRLFVAAEIPESIRRGLEALRRDLEEAPLPVRWVRAEAVHVTLKFLGEAAPERERPIQESLAIAAGSSVPFELEAAGLGTFPERGAPRVVWVGLRGDLDAAARLQQAVEEALEPLGFPRETRVFRPHLTLGRVKGPGRGGWRARFETRAADAFGRFRVGECVLFQSHLGPDGAVYEARGRFPLRAGSPG